MLFPPIWPTSEAFTEGSAAVSEPYCAPVSETSPEASA